MDLPCATRQRDRIRVPVHVMRAEQTLPLNVAVGEWLASQTRTVLLECPGGHLAVASKLTRLEEASARF
jgi:hypothetical protein